MRIKEVAELTGLTDRAIRLYIANGLVAPENHKNYTGRNSYNFTDNDVVILKQIALLRKADFSIEQIRILRQENDAARNMLVSFVSKKHAQMDRDKKLLTALDEVVAKHSFSITYLCEKLESSLHSKPIPEVDLRRNKGEELERLVFLLLSGILGMWAASIFVWIAILEFREFPFSKFYHNIENYMGVIVHLLPLSLALIVFMTHIKPRFFNSTKKAISIFLVVVTVLLLISPFDVFFCIHSPIYSETNNPSNYLQIRSGFFPAAIPRSAVSLESQSYPPTDFPETTKYYYKHEHDFDPYYDIYAEWVLTEDEYRAEISRILALYQDSLNAECQWGDWSCLSFTEYALEDAATLDSYDYVLFAYNNKTFAVRYIVAYSVDWGDSIDPYFLSLEW